MSLFSMAGDVLGSLRDMKELGGLQEMIDGAVKELIDSGKCPEELQNAFTAMKDGKEGMSADESMEALKKLVKTMMDHKDALPADIQEKIGKYADVVKDLEGKADDLKKLMGK